MPSVSKKYFSSLKIIIALVSLFFVCLKAQETNIKSLRPQLLNNDLYINCHFANLINKNMQETLASGMSSSFTFYLQLINLRGALLKERTKTVHFRYNVWEKKYILSFPGKEKQFSDYKHFRSFLYDSLHIKFSTIKGIPSTEKLKLVLHFLPEKISANQKKKLAFWINNANESQESAPAKEASSGFSINLSRLISGFLGSEANVKTQKFSTRPFTINALRNDENAAR